MTHTEMLTMIYLFLFVPSFILLVEIDSAYFKNSTASAPTATLVLLAMIWPVGILVYLFVVLCHYIYTSVRRKRNGI